MSSVSRVLQLVEPVVGPVLDSVEALAVAHMKSGGEPFEALVVLLRAADRHSTPLPLSVLGEVTTMLDRLPPRYEEDVEEMRAAMGRLASA